MPLECFVTIPFFLFHDFRKIQNVGSLQRIAFRFGTQEMLTKLPPCEAGFSSECSLPAGRFHPAVGLFQ